MGSNTWMALRKRLISAKMKEAFSNSYLQVKIFNSFQLPYIQVNIFQYFRFILDILYKIVLKLS